LRNGDEPFLNLLKGNTSNMKKHHLFIVFILVSTIVLAGCGQTAATPTPLASESAPTTEPQQAASADATTPTTLTPDACSTGQVEAEVQKVHRHMREFDDASILASSTPRDQLSNSIADLQRIRREAEDEIIPACLTTLKKYEVEHMNSVINTLIAFMGGADQQSLDQGISLARQQHDQYTLELARLLGLTIVAATPPPSATETPAP
jgi:hypothetical protein